MSVSENLILTGARWSLVAYTGCPRAGLYGHQDAPEDELSLEQQRRREERFQLGHDLSDKHRERDVRDLEAEGHRCEIEAEIRWPADDPIGVGHADLLVQRPDGSWAVCEYTTTKGAELGEHKALQCAGYALNAGATIATVVSIDPSTGHRENYPLDVEGLAPRVRELQTAVVDAIQTGETPRTCSHPGEGRSKGCPFVTHCFRDWEPTPLDELVGLDEKLRTLADAEDLYAESRQTNEEARRTRDQLRAELRDYLPPNQEVVGAIDTDASGIRIKRSVFDKTTFSLSDAKKAGQAIPEHLQPFVKTHTEERWSIRRIPGAA